MSEAKKLMKKEVREQKAERIKKEITNLQIQVRQALAENNTNKAKELTQRITALRSFKESED